VNFISTRDPNIRAGLTQAIVEGIARDGGLYVPVQLPVLPPESFPDSASLAEVAAHLLGPFAEGDSLGAELEAICREAFVFPAPLSPLAGAPGPASVLELFHGPTCAFKDFGARFLAAALERIRRGAGRKLTVLVATSGDTGGAVAASLHGRPWVNVVLLYPKGLVSPRQAHQLACWGGNVRTFAVAGTFDDCQGVVKAAFRDPVLARELDLSSANSINLGRLLPQAAYYALASLAIWRAEGRRPNFIVPTGNLGNAVACVWAREIGLPIGDVVLATNANRPIPDYLESGEWRPRPSVATLASAMDVGDPSNMERLRWLFPGIDTLRGRVTAHAVSDDEIREEIRSGVTAFDRVWCPHTATAARVYRQLARDRAGEHWVLVATAHPAKFSEIVEPLAGRDVPMPPALERLLRRPRQEEDLPATLDALRERLLGSAR
jgi:threonine synthase